VPKKQTSQLLLFVFVDVIGYSLFFPLLPYYAADFGAGAALVGLMIASNAGAQFLISPVVGRLSDRFGRRPLIIFSIFGTMLSFLLLALVEPVSRYLAANLNILWGEPDLSTRAGIWAIVLLFFCRILDGVAGGNVSLARAYVSDITTEEHRAQGLGLISAAFGFGFVIGPVIGGTLSNWTQGALWIEQFDLPRFAIPAFAAALISLINLIGVFLFLPESLPANLRASKLTLETERGGIFAVRPASGL
jgi:DHA1 family tetracycline resistance protein-like MFS transporter